MVVEDFGARTTGAGIAHLPEVVLIEAGEPRGIHPDLVYPDLSGFVIADVYRDP